MEGLYQEKFNIESTRLAGWNYSSSGFYFITICTKNRICNLGEVLADNNGQYSVALTEIGKIVRDCWLGISNHFPNISLDEWVIMPNHVHGIIVIGENNGDVHGLPRDTHGRDVACNVSTGPRTGRVDLKHASSDERKQWMAHISPKPSSLPTIIRSFKSAVTKQCHDSGFDFHWQPRFYDHIIRTESSLNKIRKYIKYNPQMWGRDRNNSE